MGRANVYLPDDLERRVRAAQIPISEVCQRALLAAVDAAENGDGRFEPSVEEQYHRGTAAGRAWARTAAPDELLALVRDQRFDEIPPGSLPADLYSLTSEQGLAWEAGFTQAARTAAAAAVPREEVPAGDADPVVDDPTSTTQSRSAAPLGDDAGARIGVTVDGEPVSFDPHAAVRAGTSPLFAVLGHSDLRARLTLSLAQDAAARGTSVVLLDLSGQLSVRARGLGKNVRVVRSSRPTMPSVDDLTRGGLGLGGLLDVFSGRAGGGGMGELFRASATLPPPGHVTIFDLSGDGGLAGALAFVQAAQVLGQLTAVADHPRLVQIDLPSTMTVPPPLASAFGRLFRGARKRNAALGVSAESAQVLADLPGSASLLSTVIAFATSNPVEADRLRDLLGPKAPILVDPPGAVATPDDPTWVVLRDLQGRLGQVRLDAW